MKMHFHTFTHALSAVAIVTCGLLVLPLVALLYCIPSIRLAFDQLAYEDAMRG